MSGAEAVAGLVLGVLPLLVAAAEHYEDIFQPFTRYRKYAQELQKFQRVLEAQKTIFRNECQHLLRSIIDRDVGDQMLQERSHPFVTDDLDQKFALQLGSSGNACAATIVLIEERLGDIERQSEAFSSVISHSQKPDSFSSKEWRRCLGKKLKFSFSKSSLDECVAHLRDLNRDFVMLCSQILRTKDGSRPTRSGHGGFPDAEQKIADFQAIQKASEQVYNALGKACTVHTTHSAQLCLETKRLTSDKTQIRFEIAFDHLALSDSALSGDPIWFSIESISNDSLAGGPTVLHNAPRRPLDDTSLTLTNTLKRQEEVSPPFKCKKLKVARSTALITWKPSKDCVAAREQESRPEPILDLTPPLPDLCIRRNFCVQVRKCSHRYPKNGRDVCIGVLERTSDCQHVVYLAPPTTTDYIKTAISLAHLISSTSKKNQLRSLPQFEKLRLAKLLSVGILQFQETPWLSGGWRSQDVVFFNAGSDTEPLQQSTLTTPYLNVPVTSAQNRQSKQSSVGSTGSCLAPNALLYSLGIVLLELAYEAPLGSLQEPCDLEGGEESRYTEFFTARRLSKLLGSVLGSTYGQIVRKCLSCDFGCGDDLSKSALQVEFYRDVVCELQRLEEGFSKLQLGP